MLVDGPSQCVPAAIIRGVGPHLAVRIKSLRIKDLCCIFSKKSKEIVTNVGGTYMFTNCMPNIEKNWASIGSWTATERVEMLQDIFMVITLLFSNRRR